ncbi:uncharacterized protein LOC131231194 isoform X2 [Magnolia sinica]|uniref:uncharacterized protein LOC131231194 isoform X2 n=1 Tax=Magnolia sinica TaxID=86752 RepID=UPI00265A4798|nr:uncharacterized protein LOC131231194 isoform X2 [Magnolia sinica]XP_058083522.1 uncharacterized protein LOC131231194 isoform X2 [Magnolia sinica]
MYPMKAIRLWQSLSRSSTFSSDGAIHGVKMRLLQFMGILCTVMFYIVYRTTKCQYQHAKMEARLHPFDSVMVNPESHFQMEARLHPFDPFFGPFALLQESHETSVKVDHLPRGIVEASSDMELKPLWLTRGAKLKDSDQIHQNLLAIPAGIKQKQNVDAIVQKFFSENFTVILFHYDGNVDGWHDFHWSNKALHIVARNQTKWWFAKRFLHPDVVSTYDYIFIWDEDLGVENFHPGRYLKIMQSEGLEISQPALDPNSSEIHHSITLRKKRRKVHRRIYDKRGSVRCSEASQEPPCTGWVEGMAPVFSRAAWRCAWHLIQNDLIHGWGMDMKLGYCAQGDRRKKVGVIDSEFIFHQGIQTLGGSSGKKASKVIQPSVDTAQRLRRPALDLRSEIRKQSASELGIFQKRWDRAASEDKDWVDPFRGRTKGSQSQTHNLL